jgi:GntR family negative regulator for fad regulon and positive regulator of fabA
MDWKPVQKPAEIAENRLLEGILSGHFPINSNLPGERELAKQLGVTRPTLREAMQRLTRDGWIDIRHGKPTRVRDYWREGTMAVLAVLARVPSNHSSDFITSLLVLRILLAPEYARQALRSSAAEIAELLGGYTTLEDDPAVFAQADWDLHLLMTQRAENPIFRLLLNSFQELYILVGEQYFTFSECRSSSRAFYAALLDCARRRAECDAEALTRRVMEESLALWKRMQMGRP